MIKINTPSTTPIKPPFLDFINYIKFNTIVKILIKRTLLALKTLKEKKYNIKDIAIVGGVAANQKIKLLIIFFVFLS